MSTHERVPQSAASNSSQPQAAAADVAVFFDFENIYVSVQKQHGEKPVFRALMDACTQYGRVVIARAYADWTKPGTLYTPNALYANGIEPIYVPTYYRDESGAAEGGWRRYIKNSVDLVLCIDVMKVLFQQPHIETFVLLSGDRDFIPLVNTLRQHGKRVVLIAVAGAVSAHLIQAVDQFIAYEGLLEPVAVSDASDALHQAQDTQEIAASPVANNLSELYQALTTAVRLAQMRAASTTLAQVKAALAELLDMDEPGLERELQRHALSDFREFVLSAQTQGHVRMIEFDTQALVRLPAEDERPSARTTENNPDAAPELGFQEASALLRQALHRGLALGYTAPSLATVKPAMHRINAAFDEARLRSPQGETFLTFKDFILEAERQGIVRLLTVGDVDRVALVGDEASAIAAGTQAQFSTPPPSTGLEIVSQHLRNGERFYSLCDLRSGRLMTHVARASARDLWLYAISRHEAGVPESDAIHWLGSIGLVRAEQRAGKWRYDLAQVDTEGYLHFYYGVTEEGMHGDWLQFLNGQDLLDTLPTRAIDSAAHAAQGFSPASDEFLCQEASER